MTVNRPIPYIALLFLLVGAIFSGQADAKGKEAFRIDLFVGEQKVLSAENVSKWSLGAVGIADVRLPADAQEFVIVGQAPGNTTLLLIMSDGEQVRYNLVVREVRVIERDNIRLDFYFAEVSENSGYRVGVGWPGTVAGTATLNITRQLQTGATTASATIASEVLPRLDLAENSGWAKVIREASVVMANGEQSTFESGGELNFRIQGAVSSSIEKISYGSRIEVQPRYDRTTGRLDVKIGAVVSELSDAGPDGLPGRTYTNLKTLVNLKLGQSIVLGGIHTTSSGHGSEGLPLLSRIPVLGYLFSAKSFREAEVENLIFIVPSVVQSTSTKKRDRVAEAFEVYKHFDGGVTGDLLYQPNFPPIRGSKR